MRSFDMDGVVTAGCMPAEGDIIVTGRLFTGFATCYRECRDLGVPECVPIYMRPFGELADREAAGDWKAAVLDAFIEHCGTDGIEHWEDDPLQIEIIRNKCPGLKLILVRPR